MSEPESKTAPPPSSTENKPKSSLPALPSMPSFTIPSELRLSKKWDSVIERFATSTTIGAVSCGLASLVLFRSPMLRFGLLTFGTGFGMGEAYRFNEQALKFEKDVKIDDKSVKKEEKK